jgi:hypothetical protein
MGRAYSDDLRVRILEADERGEDSCRVLAKRANEANRIRRAEFHQRILTIDPKRLVFLDESGISATMTRRFARCLGASRKGRRRATGRYRHHPGRNSPFNDTVGRHG